MESEVRFWGGKLRSLRQLSPETGESLTFFLKHPLIPNMFWLTFSLFQGPQIWYLIRSKFLWS